MLQIHSNMCKLRDIIAMNNHLELKTYNSDSSMLDMDKNSPGSQKPHRCFAVGNELKEFCELTTAPGLNRLGARATFCSRIVWIIFLVGVYGGFSYHFYTLIGRFSSTPLLTNIATSLPYEFPDVYICPANLISISKADVPFSIDSSELQKIHAPILGCNFSCQAEQSYYKTRLVRWNTPANAYQLAVTTAEEAILTKFNGMEFSTECRQTVDGFEYIGNKSSVPIYGDTTMLLRAPKNFTNVPYISQQQCIPWNTAARQLKAAGETELADRILALNYDDAKCRNPKDIMLKDLRVIAAHSLNERSRCYKDDLINPIFNYTCFETNVTKLSPEMCTECCYNRNYKYIGLQNNACYCADTITSANIADRKFCPNSCSGDSTEFCGGSEKYMSVQNIADKEKKAFYIPFGNALLSFEMGPYCFYEDTVNGLAASYCNIPFCSVSHDNDCILSSIDEDASKRLSAKYSGNRNFTMSNRRCMRWSDVKKGLENHTLSMTDFPTVWGVDYKKYSIDQVTILTHDYSFSSQTSYCRAAQVIVDISFYSKGVAYAFSRTNVLQTFLPGCFYLNAADRKVVFEECNIDRCIDIRPSVAGFIRNKLGSANLARQFSNSLDLGLVKCSFNGIVCDKRDFQEILHPELGVCYRFIKEPFISNLSLSEIANAALEVQLFSDATDSDGLRPFQAAAFSNVLVGGTQAETVDNNLALNVIMVPDGMFPWASQAFEVTKAQKAKFKLRFDKTTRYSKPPTQGCSQIISPVTYMIENWKPMKLSDEIIEDMEDTFRLITPEQSWTIQLDTLSQLFQNYSSYSNPLQLGMDFSISALDDCVNEYVLKKFASNCKCLPTFLPIPQKMYTEYPRCFNVSDLTTLLRMDQCYMKEKLRIPSYRIEARTQCTPSCETRKFTVAKSSDPWPNLRRATAKDFLVNLAITFGYPNNLRIFRGPVGIYSAYLSYLNLDAIGDSRTAMDLVKFDYQLNVLQDQLTMVSVSAAQMYGEEVSEEEAYPLKSLLADIGGILGLWCGVCILTVCELLELSVNVAMALRHSVLLKRAASSKETPHSTGESVI